MRIIYLSFVCFFVYCCSFAKSSNVGNWLIYFGNQKINSKLNWHNEVQYRSYNFIGDTNQLLLRTGIGYNLSENNNIFSAQTIEKTNRNQFQIIIFNNLPF